jgi:hypothetical protein
MNEHEDITPEKEPSIADHPVLADINEICASITEAEALVKKLKQDLHAAVENLPYKIGANEELREEIVYHLYWFNEQVPKTTLKQAFNVVPPVFASKSKRVKVIRPLTIKRTCYSCNQPFQTQAKSTADQKSGIGICEACELGRKGQREEQDRYFQRLEVRKRELATMPYYDYLQTPEWAERRKDAMRRAGYRCQVCNAYGVQLNVHHRTYERRGNEWNKDLITLCRTCHEIFHQNGQLAQE